MDRNAGVATPDSGTRRLEFGVWEKIWCAGCERQIFLKVFESNCLVDGDRRNGFVGWKGRRRHVD